MIGSFEAFIKLTSFCLFNNPLGQLLCIIMSNNYSVKPA